MDMSAEPRCLPYRGVPRLLSASAGALGRRGADSVRRSSLAGRTIWSLSLRLASLLVQPCALCAARGRRRIFWKSRMAMIGILRVFVTLVAVSAAVLVGWWLWDFYTLSPWTRDARVQANIVEVAPDVSGLITAIDVVDNQKVAKGDVLFVIDQKRFVLAVEEAQANVAQSQATLKLAQDNADRDATGHGARFGRHIGRDRRDIARQGQRGRGRAATRPSPARHRPTQSRAQHGTLAGQRLRHQPHRHGRRLCDQGDGRAGAGRSAIPSMSTLTSWKPSSPRSRSAAKPR